MMSTVFSYIFKNCTCVSILIMSTSVKNYSELNINPNTAAKCLNFLGLSLNPTVNLNIILDGHP